MSESDLTESESHLNMLKGAGSNLQAVLQPPTSPTEQSSSVVNMSVGLLGQSLPYVNVVSLYDLFDSAA